jgi:hypothetical protein
MIPVCQCGNYIYVGGSTCDTCGADFCDDCLDNSAVFVRGSCDYFCCGVEICSGCFALHSVLHFEFFQRYFALSFQCPFPVLNALQKALAEDLLITSEWLSPAELEQATCKVEGRVVWRSTKPTL